MRDLSKRRAELLSLSQSESGRSQRLLMSLYWPWISKLSKSVGDRVLLMVVGGLLLLQGGMWLVRGILGPLSPLFTTSFSPPALDLLAVLMAMCLVFCPWKSAPSGRGDSIKGKLRDRTHPE